jgi:hypothetical protein
MRIFGWAILGIGAILGGLILTMGFKGLLWIGVALIVMVSLMRIDTIDKRG